MSLEQRYQTGYLEVPLEQPGLVQGQDGNVYVVKPDGSRFQVEQGGGGGGGGGPTDWHTVGAPGEPAYGAGWAGDIEFAKDGNGVVWMRGSADDTHATTTTIFTLPAGYLPTQVRNFLVATDFDVDTSARVTVDHTTGDVSSLTTQVGQDVYVDQVVFPTT